MSTKTNKIERFVIDPPTASSIDLKKTIKILQEIKSLHDSFPNLEISTRNNYEEIRISNISPGTMHSIELKLVKLSWKVVDHMLPILAFEKAVNLEESVKIYLRLLENLYPFYMALDMLDDICVVGEPRDITTKTTWRLVKYSNKTFIKIEFPNPLSIEEVNITFHGSTASVKEMTEIYNEKSDEFEDETIYNKLRNIFGVPYFPATDEDNIDCAICFCYMDEKNRCPILCCDNEKCDSTFHISCLENYFKVKRHVKILSVSISACPFCKQTLSNSYTSFFKNTTTEPMDQEN